MGDKLDDGTEMDGYAVPPYLREHPLFAAAQASVRAERDMALGRCPALIQCHREIGHDGRHEARA